MRRMRILGILAVLAILVCGLALAETEPVTEEEILALAERVRALADAGPVLNDPTAEESDAEDGYAFQYDFGIVYADQNIWAEDTRINAFFVMDEIIAGPREITIDWTVNRVLAAIPCDNAEMYGTTDAAVLYLEGDAKSGYLYGRAERDGQRISALEYGAVDPAAGTRAAMILGISGDGVNYLRVEGLNESFSPEDSEALYEELEALSRRYEYFRFPRSLTGTDLDMFQEADLDFSAISYQTADPGMFGSNVDDMMIDNDDGTWLRRVDGDGFVAVFSCDSTGGDAVMVSYEILSPGLEGPRGVRLGDLFHEDFTRFRSGEGTMDEAGLTETLYGTPGTAPYGIAEYGNGTEMTLRYVTPTLSGPEVELILRYEDTALAEIILHTLGKETEHAD